MEWVIGCGDHLRPHDDGVSGSMGTPKSLIIIPWVKGSRQFANQKVNDFITSFMFKEVALCKN